MEDKLNTNLLLATDYTIVEFDGTKFTPSAIVVSKTTFTSIFWNDKKNKLFGQTSNSGFFQLYPHQLNFQNICVSFLNDKYIYGLDSSGNLYSSALDTLKFIRKLNTGIKLATCLYVDESRIFIGTQKQLSVVDWNGNVQVPRHEEFMHLNSFQKADLPNEFFALGAYSVYKISGKDVERIFDLRAFVPETQGYVNIKGFYPIGHKNYMVVLTNGIVILNEKSSHFYKGGIIPSDYIETSFYSKTDDCYYLGTRDKGLLKLQFKTCFSLTNKNGLLFPGSICSVIKTAQNELLTVDVHGSVYELKKDTFVPYFYFNSATASLAEFDGNVFFGTWNEGLYVLRNKKIVKHLSDSLELTNNSVLSVYKTKNRIIWVGTFAGVSRGTSLETVQPFLPKTIRGRTICFYELRNGSVCLGGNDEVFIIDKNGKIETHLTAENGLEGEVRTFYEDRLGRIWIGTGRSGLFCFNKKKLTSLNKMKGCFLQQEVFCLAPDGLGYLYMTSNQGLWKIKEQDLFDFYLNRKSFLIPFYYGQEAGIFNTEFNGGFQNNFLKLDTAIFFPSQKGLVIVKPEKPIIQKLVPSIYCITANDSLFGQSDLTFKPGTYSIRFNFSSELNKPEYNVYYQYKLTSGSETILNWNTLQREKFVEFKLLPPGKYILSIRAISAFNDKDPVVTETSFEILPLFYQTLLFKLGIGLIAFLVIFWIMKMRINFHRKLAEKRERHKLQTLELQLRAIHAELNPHFVFNCINCIKYFVMEKNYKRANNGLIKLSKMIRASVEDAGKLFMPLDKELKAIENYIELEKMRLKDKLQYEIVVHEEALLNREIPHLVIQPFIEIAIKHGISNLSDRNGLLKIDFQLKGEMLVCTIVDNGIGRKAAHLINSQIGFHNSKGIKLSQEKINLLNANYNYDCKCRIIDLYDEKKIGNGTMVVIEMPVNNHTGNTNNNK